MKKRYMVHLNFKLEAESSKDPFKLLEKSLREVPGLSEVAIQSVRELKE